MSILDTVRKLPGVERWRKAKYKKKFAVNNNHNLFRGVYHSFAEAELDIPNTKPVGYDNPGPAAMYREVMENIREWDYPVMHWINKNLPQAKSLFDFGGHTGILYYGFSHYIDFPEDFRWTVYDVPAVTKAGAAIANEKGVAQLNFTNNTNDASGYDLYVASGSLQYVDKPLAEILTDLDASPRHLIINMLPMHEHEEFITVNNMGTAYCPYKVFHRQRFLDSLQQQGWVLRDLWINPGKSCEVPFYPRYNHVTYYGMYFTRSN